MIPTLSAATPASAIMTTDGLRVTAVVSTRVREDSGPGAWSAVDVSSPSGCA